MDTILQQLMRPYLHQNDFLELSVSLGRFSFQDLVSFWLDKLTLNTFKTDGTKWQSKFDQIHSDHYELCEQLLLKIRPDSNVYDDCYLLPFTLSDMYEGEGDYKTQGYKGIRVLRTLKS